MSHHSSFGHVLLDNFTLQGAHCYLVGNEKGILYEECLANLIESAVIYDKIFVPGEVLEANPACQKIKDMMGNEVILEAKKEFDHYFDPFEDNVIGSGILSSLKKVLEKENPFKRFNKKELLKVESTGYHEISEYEFLNPRGYEDYRLTYYNYRTRDKLDFSLRHAHYSYYCLKLARELGLNYVPNPTRIDLIKNLNFLIEVDVPDIPNVRRDILERLHEVRQNQNAVIAKFFKSYCFSINLPIVYNYVKQSARNIDDIIDKTLKLRNSKKAAAFRKYCIQLENYFRRGDREAILDKITEINRLLEQWSTRLTRKRAEKKLNIVFVLKPVGLPLNISADVNIPWINLSDPQRKPHFIFLHELLSEL
jgi:hypothetical protein